MARQERVAAIQALQAERDGNIVLAYVTSTRPNYESHMAMDVVPILYEHLAAIQTPPEETKIDLFLSSNGGDGVVPWKLVTLIREFCSEFNVLVPHRAFSAATLTCLGADSVVMHPMGMLGPTDPTVTNDFNPTDPHAQGRLLGISVEDVASYIALVKEDVGIHHEDELVKAFLKLAEKVHPLALGNVKRHTLQSQMMGAKLLRSRAADSLEDHEIKEIIQKLTSELFFHGHPINRSEARHDIGLSFVQDAAAEVREKMWDLYTLYAEENLLNEEWMPIQEAIAINPLPVPTTTSPVVASVPLPVIRSVSVESVARSDVFKSRFEVTLSRDRSGTYNGQVGLMAQAWERA
jgi:Serine dehydrogenase proteinase